jgi:hypothetical protein
VISGQRLGIAVSLWLLPFLQRVSRGGASYFMSPTVSFPATHHEVYDAHNADHERTSSRERHKPIAHRLTGYVNHYWTQMRFSYF